MHGHAAAESLSPPHRTGRNLRGAPDLGLDKHPPWQAGVHLNAPESAAPHLVKALQQTNDLIAHDEVVEAEFWPWPLIRIQLHVSQRHWPRIEYGLGVPD